MDNDCYRLVGHSQCIDNAANSVVPLSFFNVWKIASGTIAQSTALPEMQLASGIRVIMVWLLGLLAAAAIGSLNFSHHSSFKASSKADAAENERSY